MGISSIDNNIFFNTSVRYLKIEVDFIILIFYIIIKILVEYYNKEWVELKEIYCNEYFIK